MWCFRTRPAPRSCPTSCTRTARRAAKGSISSSPMPSIERLRRAMEGRPFAILAVNVGESGRVARDFAEKLPVAFTVLLDRDARASRAWGARVLPASFLVGPDGAIRYSYFGDLDWSSDEVRRRIESLI